MQNYYVLESTNEVLDERLKVLSDLVVLDPGNSKTYEEELRDITRSRLLQKAVREVEQSKVFVDTNSIKKTIEKELRQDFSRFSSLLAAGLGGDAHSFRETIKELAARGDPLAPALEVPKNESASLCTRMMVRIFNECIGNPEHGLDCYLSMRIRHGTLFGQMRTPVEQEFLVTQKAPDGQGYLENAYWKSELEWKIDSARIHLILGRLNKFSQDYDQFVATISNDLVQIGGQEKPNGLLGAPLMSVHILFLYHEIEPDITFEEFWDKCVDQFYEVLSKRLFEAQKYFHSTIKVQARAIFDDLENDLRELAQGDELNDLLRAVRIGNTQTDNAIGIVASWFKLPKPIQPQAFSLEDMIDVGKTCVTTIYRDFEPQVTKHIPLTPPIYDALPLFSDIFFIVFDNIRKHSGLDRPTVALTVNDRESHFSIEIVSQISRCIVLEELRSRVSQIENRISRGEIGKAIRGEGGTGLIKISRLIAKDAGTQNTLTFGVTDDGQFSVKFTWAKREIQL
jgi:hypothetical protein